MAPIKVIYNPNAGKKRAKIGAGKQVSLGEIQKYFVQYAIEADFFPTEGPGHATQLAKNAIEEGYTTVIGLGGDGTIGEIAQGLVNTDIRLGLLPLGSYMNIAKMLGIPRDIEKAVMLLKLGRTRKIDVGAVTQLDGHPLSEPIYFIESVGLGIDAQIHSQFVRLERGEKKAIISMIRSLFEYSAHKTKITADQTTLNTRALSISISNAPFTGANLELAPEAKLNDHLLTVTVNAMSIWRYVLYIYFLMKGKQLFQDRFTTLQTKKIELNTIYSRLVHIDGRDFGVTPITCEVVSAGLSVISGFSMPEDSAFKENMSLYLD